MDRNNKDTLTGSERAVEQVAEGRKGNAPGTRHNVSEAQAAPPESRLSLDDLLDRHLSGPEYSEGNHKGVDYNKVLDELPSDAKKLIQNLRSDYQRKTTDLSMRRKALKMREESILSTSADRLREAAQLPENIDLYDPEGLKTYIEAKAAEQLQSLLAPARAKLEKDTRIEQVRRFQVEHPDINSMREPIAQLIKDKGMNIEDAYFHLKGKAYSAALEKKNSEIETYKRAAKEAGLKVSVGTPTSKAKPRFNTAWDAYQFIKSQNQ